MMTREQFGQAILECFSEVYGKSYIGSLFITKLPKGFDVAIGFNHRETPLHITAELDEDKYIEFFKKELRERRFDCTQYSHVSLEYPESKLTCKCQTKN